ncbi:MAG: metalloregulator ArsR/SmtB family transcription factor [candidate division Zixibacteria bacterium]|nr:metalloregulator ArsR/SmtB family transcription factor [candidate division Zixibacteria bacterium]
MYNRYMSINENEMKTDLRSDRGNSKVAIRLAETFRVLGDTSKLRICMLLQDSELPVCKIAGQLGLSESAVSHSLRILRGLRLVRNRRQGRNIFYSLDDDHVRRLIAIGCEHVEEET